MRGIRAGDHIIPVLDNDGHHNGYRIRKNYIVSFFLQRQGVPFPQYDILDRIAHPYDEDYAKMVVEEETAVACRPKLGIAIAFPGSQLPIDALICRLGMPCLV
jgi:hypothetical protein